LLTSIKYGEYKIESTWESDLYGNILKVRHTDYARYTYERYGSDGNVIVSKIIDSIVDNITLCIYPLVPIYTPEKADYAKHVMIKLKEPIVVNIRSTVEFYLKMPVEVGVFYKYDGKSMMIDAFALRLLKYALYGTSDNGLICRYYESSAYFTMPRIEPFKECIVHIRLSNYLDKPATVNMLVIPVDGIDLWYDGTDALLDTVNAIIKQGIKGNDIIEVKVEESTEYKYAKTSVNPSVASRVYTMELGF
jgi:hypothetical protein